MQNESKISLNKPMVLAWLFPIVIICLYILGFYLAPDKTEKALLRSSTILLQVIGPMGLALVMMMLLNRFLSPLLAIKYMGQRTGIKGVLFSSLAGILSMGPIYAWYPLFATLKEKGASSFHIANFMGCRSIKPVLVPFLVAYFGWLFSVFFLLANFISALVVAWGVSIILFEGRNNKMR